MITEEFRRLGIGKELIRRAEQWARNQGCRKVVLRSNMQRETAHIFYPSIGYTRVKSSLSYRKEL